MPAFDPLLAFAHWYLAQPGFGMPQTPFNGLSRVGSFSGIVLLRQPPYQVQLWIADPNSHITEHTHPNVDQIHIFISGSADFKINGKLTASREAIKRREDGFCNAYGMSVRVNQSDKEEAHIGPDGWAFMTIQHWLKGEPRSVEINWEGEPLSADHAIAIKQ